LGDAERPIVQLTDAREHTRDVAGTRFLKAFAGEFDLIERSCAIVDNQSLHNFADVRDGLG